MQCTYSYIKVNILQLVYLLHEGEITIFYKPDYIMNTITHINLNLNLWYHNKAGPDKGNFFA